MEDKRSYYFCPLCGKPLYEDSMGMLVCSTGCTTLFIPTMRIRDELVPPGQHMNECCLSWMEGVKDKKMILYAIGEDIGEGQFGMWSGPNPNEAEMLVLDGKSDKSVIIRFDDDNTEEVIWRWNSKGNKWEKVYV